VDLLQAVKGGATQYVKGGTCTLSIELSLKQQELPQTLYRRHIAKVIGNLISGEPEFEI